MPGKYLQLGWLELICVTLSDPDDWQDHAALYDWAYGEYRCVRYPAGTVLAQVPVVSGADTQRGRPCRRK